MRLMLLCAFLTIMAVAGIDRLTNKPVVSMDEWACEPSLVRVETNNGPLYYCD